MIAIYDTAKNFNRVLYWDDENRLTKSVDTTNGGSVATEYAYDTKGMRIIKDGPYGKSIYVDTGYIESGTSRASAPAMVSNHVFVGNTRIASVVKHKEEAQAAMYFYASDHLGSSSVLTNQQGSYHERIEYLPYGETWVEDAAQSGSYSTTYKFTGKELDKETGLYYFGARYYEPSIARWINADKAMQHIDLYMYCRNNPIVFLDPDGNVDIESRLNYFLARTFGTRGTIQVGYRVTADNGDFRFSDASIRAIKNAIPLYGVIEEISNVNFGGAIREGTFFTGTTIAASAITKNVIGSTLIGALLSAIVGEGYYQITRKLDDKAVGELNAFAADHLAIYAYAKAYGCAYAEFENGKTTMYTGDADRSLVEKRMSAIKELMNPTLKNIKSANSGQLIYSDNPKDYQNFFSLSIEDRKAAIAGVKAAIYNKNSIGIWPAGKGWADKK